MTSPHPWIQKTSTNIIDHLGFMPSFNQCSFIVLLSIFKCKFIRPSSSCYNSFLSPHLYSCATVSLSVCLSIGKPLWKRAWYLITLHTRYFSLTCTHIRHSSLPKHLHRAVTKYSKNNRSVTAYMSNKTWILYALYSAWQEFLTRRNKSNQAIDTCQE
jgi:hypothetical protein